MKQHLLFLCILLANMLPTPPLKAAVPQPVPLPGGDFESGTSAWPLTEEYAIGDWGRNGTKGLKCEKTSGYKFMSRPVALKPGANYRLSWWEKIDGQLPGDGAAVSIDWYANGAWVSFVMLSLQRSTSNEWQFFSREFATPDNPDLSFMLLVYLRSNSPGRVYFDDFTLEELPPEVHASLLNAPCGRLPQNVPLEIAISGVAQPVFMLHVRLLAVNGDIAFETTVECRNNRALLPLDHVKDGSYSLELSRAQDKNILLKTPLTLETKPSGRVRLDNFGRCLVDGKPFMPVGWYVGNVALDNRHESSGRCSLARLADSPFNVILPYNRPNLPESPVQDVVMASQEALDACAAHGQMVIYSVKDCLPADRIMDTQTAMTCDAYVAKLANGLKHHPALLAWYIGDEAAKNTAAPLRARRHLLNRLDPDHPTWAVFCAYADLPTFNNSCDLLGIDPYPFNAPSDRGIQAVVLALKDTRKAALRSNGELGLWSVIQAHNVGVYDEVTRYATPEAFFAATRVPSLEELRTMALMHAIGGAKGFLFYSEFDFHKGFESKRFEQRWKEACQVAQMLRDLEPWILSTMPRPPVVTRNVKGVTAVRAMCTPTGQLAVLLATTGCGDHETELSELPSGLVSQYGLTQEISPGIYRFRGTDAANDILKTP